MKLQSKTRVGGKIHRQYGPALTPYQRLLDSGQLRRKAEKQLRQQYESLNVAVLWRKIDELRDRLFRMVENKPGSEGIQMRRKGPGFPFNAGREVRFCIGCGQVPKEAGQRRPGVLALNAQGLSSKASPKKSAPSEI